MKLFHLQCARAARPPLLGQGGCGLCCTCAREVRCCSCFVPPDWKTVSTEKEDPQKGDTGVKTMRWSDCRGFKGAAQLQPHRGGSVVVSQRPSVMTSCLESSLWVESRLKKTQAFPEELQDHTCRNSKRPLVFNLCLTCGHNTWCGCY